jgi:predicted GTPase
MKDLEATINATPCDLVLVATPVDLSRLLTIEHPHARIRYEYKDNSRPSLEDILREKFA